MGFYTDPYGDFGRLSMEILRAGRLVTDTGIHAKRWSREQAIDWYMANTPVTRGDVVNQVERFVVFPGQATAYTVGKLKILAAARTRPRRARHAVRHSPVPRRGAEIGPGSARHIGRECRRLDRKRERRRGDEGGPVGCRPQTKTLS